MFGLFKDDVMKKWTSRPKIPAGRDDYSERGYILLTKEVLDDLNNEMIAESQERHEREVKEESQGYSQVSSNFLDETL